MAQHGLFMLSAVEHKPTNITQHIKVKQQSIGQALLALTSLNKHQLTNYCLRLQHQL